MRYQAWLYSVKTAATEENQTVARYLGGKGSSVQRVKKSNMDEDSS